ncbi:MFS transporter [Sulfolobus sp. A20]|uniref:MFS transporter n=1 Tax=Saccharolobus sp. A20 TaxID=1891280 RepID=UPI000845FA42|nr:MFS transporter [Sulfolobus sp. A20]TRM77309.1 MFS transporter [Sulfolobus sp. A20-N-F8]TRM79485.1 MFS transporter [Sulfolobus sp. B5]TRM84536.1 MFS transporter [Sulfolobus sp. F3]TRM89030.1 MFS transporter [Sulfolobus sp. C3]TRM99003.1 MFS transporter [Sulfolobus sp. E1]TRN04065.1 MFS transporter [Sulfolobus sp. F1]
MKYLKVYAILSNLANNLVSPFISFVSAYFGMSSEQIALITAATNAVPNISQYFLSFIKSRARFLLFIGTLTNGILWILSSFIKFNWIFLIIYFAITITGGIANFGWLLIMNKVSVNNRGKTLSSYLVYTTIGGMLATFITGLITEQDTELIKYFFMTSGLLLNVSSLVANKIEVDVDNDDNNKNKGNNEIRRFLVSTFMFNLVLSLAWPIFPIAQVYKFHMNDEQVAIMSIETGVFTVVFQRIIAKLTDVRRTLTMFLGSSTYAIYPMSYYLSNSVFYLYLANALSGFTNGVYSITFIAYLFDKSTRYNLKNNLALYNLVIGSAIFIGSILGGYIYGVLENIYGVIASINIMLLTTTLLRLSVSPLFLIVDKAKKL